MTFRDMPLLVEQIRGVSYKPEDIHDCLDATSITLLRANNIVDGAIDLSDAVYVDRKCVSEGQILRRGDILICASSGSKNLVGKAAQFLLDGEFTFGAFCKVVRPKEAGDFDYISMFFQSPTYRREISSLAIGVNINNIRNEHIDSLRVTWPDADTRKAIVEQLQALMTVIQSRQRQLRTLDTLIKARFVEMFGDPVHNTTSLPVLPMTEVCEIIDGDRGKNYPKQEEFFDDEYCLFLNAKNVTNHGFDFTECMFITKEKDESLRKGKLKRGDVVLTTRGTVGNLAFFTNEIPFENVRINSGMVILRMNKQVMDEEFFIVQFRMQIENIKKSVASGSAQPQLPISTMNKISVIMPDLSMQRQFATFVAQVNKSKATIQEALNKAQLLFDSLMQQYFG